MLGRVVSAADGCAGMNTYAGQRKRRGQHHVRRDARRDHVAGRVLRGVANSTIRHRRRCFPTATCENSCDSWANAMADRTNEARFCTGWPTGRRMYDNGLLSYGYFQYAGYLYSPPGGVQETADMSTWQQTMQTQLTSDQFHYLTLGGNEPGSTLVTDPATRRSEFTSNGLCEDGEDGVLEGCTTCSGTPNQKYTYGLLINDVRGAIGTASDCSNEALLPPWGQYGAYTPTPRPRSDGSRAAPRATGTYGVMELGCEANNAIAGNGYVHSVECYDNPMSAGTCNQARYLQYVPCLYGYDCNDCGHRGLPADEPAGAYWYVRPKPSPPAWRPRSGSKTTGGRRTTAALT